jgi:hypothetical protein
VSSSKIANAVPLPVPQMEGKLNETGFKSTQETFLQRSNSVASKSVSMHKKSNKHHHCNSNSKQSHTLVSKRTNLHVAVSVTAAISGIKTRNMRKANSNEPKSPKQLAFKKTKK